METTDLIVLWLLGLATGALSMFFFNEYWWVVETMWSQL